jgi:hypothetical protein
LDHEADHREHREPRPARHTRSDQRDDGEVLTGELEEERRRSSCPVRNARPSSGPIGSSRAVRISAVTTSDGGGPDRHSPRRPPDAGQRRVNVYSSSRVCDGRGRFGFILWVEPEDFDKAFDAFGIGG